LVHEFNLGPVDFELDAKRVVNSFYSQNCDATKFGNIIDHCKSLCINLYENSSVDFVRRQSNKVYNSLAKAALLSPGFQIWVEKLEYILINEMQ